TATWPACQRARAEPRVATRSLITSASPGDALTLYLEQLTQSGDQAIAPGASGRVLEDHCRLVEQLGDQALRHRVDQVRLVGADAVRPLAPRVAQARVGGAELAEPAAVAVELRLARHLGPLPQGHDHRCHLAG